MISIMQKYKDSIEDMLYDLITNRERNDICELVVVERRFV